jgi:nucleoside-diphosphate-sugar epimerase
MVLVTGATGFIGAALVQRLRRDGHAVTELAGDVRDPHAVGASVDRAGGGVAYHLAGVTTRGDAHADTSAAFSVNATGTAAVLAAAHQHHGFTRVVVASTDALSRSGRASDPYERSKEEAEAVARCYRDRGLDVVVARLANVYGPGDRSMGRLVPAASVEAQFTPLEPQSTLDLVHVTDVVAALIALGGGAGDVPVHRVASGTLVTVAAVVDAVRDLARGYPPAEIPVTPYESAVPLVPGWAPEVTLEAGLAETVAWYRARHQGVG